MLDKLQKRKDSGFTIVEVMIVLAIAGLVILIVFLAVPALQRNSRNTQAANEASNVIGGVNEFVSNNNGKMPAVSASGTANSDAAKVLANVKLQNVTTINVVQFAAAGVTAPSETAITVVRGAKCVAPVTTNYTGTGVVSAGASRQIAVLYPMENTAGNATGCVES